MIRQETDISSTGSDIHILYVEGATASGGFMKKQLERSCRFRVETAADGEQALHLLRERHFHTALVNFVPSAENGLRALHAIRAGDTDLPIIILNGESNEEIAVSVMKAGAFDYLVKGRGNDFVERLNQAVHSAFAERQRHAQQKRVFARWQLAEKVFDVTREGIVVTNSDNVIEAVNPAFSAITGYAFDEAVGQNPRLLQSGRHDKRFYQQMWEAIHTHGSWEGEIWNKKKSGEIYPEWLTVHAIFEGDRIIQYIAVFTDISTRKKDEAKIWHQANYDALTDLPNRTLLEDRAREAMQRAKRDRTSMAVIFIDLDRFKYINDHYGHAVGDALLVAVAGRISSTLRKSDTVIRVSGDEFVVLMPQIKEPMDAGRVAEKIIASVSQPYLISDARIHISASAGIAVYPGDGDNVEALMSHADVAMYKAKENGRNQHLFFDQKMNDEAENRAEVEADLLVALRENQLLMYYQPVIDLRTNRITHAEALVRWMHPTKGMIPPNDFVPVAEQCGLIIPLGEWVANEVCRQMEDWRKTRKEDLQVFLNVSPIQLMHANLDKHLMQALDRFALPQGSIGIEITENVLIDGPEKIKPVLDRLKAEGLSFVIDDFGTGFSSMRYLRKLPFDGLKVDRSFVSGVDQDHEKGVLVKAMINMAHSLNLNVVAEGVETEEELAFLRAHDCDFVQGYLLGRPMPAERFFEALQA